MSYRCPKHGNVEVTTMGCPHCIKESLGSRPPLAGLGSHAADLAEMRALAAEIRTLKADLAAEREALARAEAALARFQAGHPCPACEQDMSLCCPKYMQDYMARVVRERDEARRAIADLEGEQN